MTAPSRTVLIFSVLATFILVYAILIAMSLPKGAAPFLIGLSSLSLGSAQRNHEHGHSNATCGASNTSNISLEWYSPADTQINNLPQVLNGSDIYGFIFNSSQGSPDTYNFCNMPHTNPTTYPKVSSDYTLEYVEVIQRHHKRTPYADNTFPEETYPWYCDDEALAFGGKPINPYGNESAATYWDVYTSPSNPLRPDGFNGTCQFPQITREGLDDSWEHGVDLKAVYSGMLGFIPSEYDSDVVSYRVTNNVITSQVASMLIAGMYPSRANTDTPLLIQPESIDSLQPGYSCPYSSDLFGSYGSGSSSPAWREHMERSSDLKARLDAISGVDPDDSGWTMSWDHYFDNLSARLCHSKPLPCQDGSSSNCVTMAEAYKVFRLGQYEYSFVYRDSEESLPASTAGYGIWVGELAQNLRDAMDPAGAASHANQTSGRVKYLHNVAHDGSVSRLLSILQLDEMVWPGMGSEVVFELYSRDSCWFVRVLWGGQVMKSSHPELSEMDMVPVDTLMAYFDGLVGRQSRKVPGLCEQ